MQKFCMLASFFVSVGEALAQVHVNVMNLLLNMQGIRNRAYATAIEDRNTALKKYMKFH